MRINLKLARAGMNMQEATIVKWHRQVGDAFASGEPLYDIETEKVTQEVTAMGDGRLIEIKVPAGGTIEVGGIVCVVEMTFKP